MWYVWVLAPPHSNISFQFVFSPFISANPHSNLIRLEGQDLLSPFERSGDRGSEESHHMLKVTKQWLGPLPADPQTELFFFFFNIYMIKRVIVSKCNSDMPYSTWNSSLALYHLLQLQFYLCVWNTNSWSFPKVSPPSLFSNLTNGNSFFQLYKQKTFDIFLTPFSYMPHQVR